MTANAQKLNDFLSLLGCPSNPHDMESNKPNSKQSLVKLTDQCEKILEKNQHKMLLLPESVFQKPPPFDDLPARAPLPSAADIRSRVPPQGISPKELSRSYGNMIVGRGLYRDEERREQFWNLVAENAILEKEVPLLRPLHNEAYLGPPLRPPPPSVADIRARISYDGISSKNLSASYGDMIMGLGLFYDEERVRHIACLVDQNAFLDEENDLLRLLPDIPTACNIRSRVSPAGISIDELIGQFGNVAGWPIVRKCRFRELLSQNTVLDQETNLLKLIPKIPTAASLRSRIPPEGILVSDLFVQLAHLIGWREVRKSRFMELLLANAVYDKKTRMVTPRQRKSNNKPQETK